jgi:hypothetical protein
VAGYFRDAGVVAFATTHTCLPFAQTFPMDGRPRLIINNGSAGMPNFKGRPGGLLTRVSALPDLPPGSLYGATIEGLRFDALPILYDEGRWLRRFLRSWPPGSPAHRSYYGRIAGGPAYTLERAVRLGHGPGTGYTNPPRPVESAAG